MEHKEKCLNFKYGVCKQVSANSFKEISNNFSKIIFLLITCTNIPLLIYKERKREPFANVERRKIDLAKHGYLHLSLFFRDNSNMM